MRYLALAPLLVLAACGGSDEAAPPNATDTTTPVEPNGGTGDGATPLASPTPAVTADIPADLRGRWGMNAADCEPGRADAKGLLTISADKLEFYESVGTLEKVAERMPSRIRATFAFTGEGMNWHRDMALETTGDGNTLTRREFGEDAAPDPFSYMRCS